MQRFWVTVIEPIFGLVQPSVIVEIGSGQGGNTQNLLEFCRKSGAKLHVIDPAPGYDVAEWQREHGEHAVFHQDLSLSILPRIEGFDAVLVDGDHNWYTVFNELKLIEKYSRGFPLVILHDVGWPYGRRDLYYAPETIPANYRKPLEKKGMLPGVPHLLEEGGLNEHFCNASQEAEPQNGVLTAVEDFLEETREPVELITLPGIYGLGIIVPRTLKEQNPKLADFLKDLDFSPFVMRYIEEVERDRISKEIEIQRERRKHGETRRDLAQLTRWGQEMDEKVSAMLQSRQWKVGSAIGEVYRVLWREPRKLPVQRQLEETLKRFRIWRADYRQSPGGSPTGEKGGQET